MSPPSSPVSFTARVNYPGSPDRFVVLELRGTSSSPFAISGGPPRGIIRPVPHEIRHLISEDHRTQVAVMSGGGVRVILRGNATTFEDPGDFEAWLLERVPEDYRPILRLWRLVRDDPAET